MADKENYEDEEKLDGDKVVSDREWRFLESNWFLARDGGLPWGYAVEKIADQNLIFTEKEKGEEVRGLYLLLPAKFDDIATSRKLKEAFIIGLKEGGPIHIYDSNHLYFKEIRAKGDGKNLAKDELL